MNFPSTNRRTWVGVTGIPLFLLVVPSVLADSADDWQKMRRITPRGYVCLRAGLAPRIDGRLDDPAWTTAPWTDEFVDIEGAVRPQPRFRTRAKLLWDERYFYIAAQLQDPHVWATLQEHDAVMFHDNDFELFIDPDGDNHEYYEFEINALNTGWDLFLPRPYKDGGRANSRWEIPGLETAVHVDGTLNDPTDRDQGWSVEIAIPWGPLGQFAHRPAPPQDGQRWRVNFSRVQWRLEVDGGRYVKVPQTREDNWVWSAQGIIDMHRPERWGYVQFSSSTSPTGPYRADPALATRDMLMGIYHQQKSFFQRHNRWARSWDELASSQPALPAEARTADLKITAAGFEATIDLPRPGKPPQPWHVRQDSRIWSD